ncbi:sulfurtransferase [Salinirubellus salinus]|jgi:thiosulfate/3-mercaptopyruvate sulfurtransferase|uniref:Sulfurtransferase n=1 Tax=Salinirubellus salinus TaxID=1364945 RepID=A0A9E7QZR3_9EURY|nr:sulfurtransferase [Salinirubellus salinus]UWM53021.1 sulfurtransferase [Salinirubellus salinus]
MSDIVVAPAWVTERLGDADVRLVDVREAWEYDGIGHLPGAVNVPFDSFRSADGGEAGMLPGAEVFGDLLSAAGIENDDHLVAYDDTHGVFAARFLVTAELYGHPRERLHLLDGDFSAWQREGEVSREAPTVDPSEYHAAYDPGGPLVEMDTVEAALSDPDTVVVDTREQWEYEEGHIPGAVRLDWLELVDQDSRGLRPVEEIRAILRERDIDPERRVVLYCNTARRISHTYVVLRHLGFTDLAFYEGSLTEWEAEGGELETV